MHRKRVRTARKGTTPRKKRVRRGALTVAAAATATTMALAPMTPTPRAEADIIDDICGIAVIKCDFSTAGILIGPAFLITQLLYSIPILEDVLPPGTIDVPGLGPINVNALIPQILGHFNDHFVLPSSDILASGLIGQQGTPLGTHTIIGFMDGALTTGRAITKVQSGITPLFGVNNYNYLLIRNPGRANGGLASRFNWLTGLFESTVSGNVSAKQDPTVVPCAGGVLCNYIPVKADIGLGFDAMSDFPIAPIASVSIINSILQSIFPTNFLGGQEFVLQDAGNLNFYITAVPNDSALLEPLRLGKRIADLTDFNIPIITDIFATIPAMIADALEPAADILINIGYSDVDLTTYERSFTDFNTNKQFFFDSTLTIDQYFAAVGAAFSAAITGLTSIFTGSPSAATGPAQPSSAAAAQASDAGPAQTPDAAAGDAAAQPAATGVAQSAAPAARSASSRPTDATAPTSRTDKDETITEAAADNTATKTRPGRTSRGADAAADDRATADRTPTRARERTQTAEDKLDAAAEKARTRAESALAGAHDRVNTAERADSAGDQTAVNAPDPTASGPAAAGTPGKASAASADAAA